MLLLSTSLMSVAKTKTGQTPKKGAKPLAQKSSKKQQTTTKTTPKTEKVSPEEDAIIRAAEKYHQQISGKKVDTSVAPTTNKEAVSTMKGKAVVSPKTGKEAFRQNIPAAEVQSSGAQRDPGVNIYTGNPGIYRTEGDTLNFWSFTPVVGDTVEVKSALTGQPAKPYGFEGKPVKKDTQDWTFFLIIFGWIIFASLRFGFSKYVVQVFQSAFNYSASSRLYRERGYSSNFGMFRLNLIFFLFLPLPVFLIAKDNGVSLGGSSGIEFYLIVFAVVNAYFMLKILLYKILGSVFSQRETTGELVFNMMLYHNVLGLILLPVATIHYMVPAFGLVSLFMVPGFIAIFYLMSLSRSIYFALREGISIFYLILYLCALEILPILLVVKVATGG
ncbi:MAG TPA: DUF4271 domain-containing protein [Prolixibacteraceae bacterium]|nr:DUF4271 domain-containing protein [Prolixibacteraceae bacterium]